MQSIPQANELMLLQMKFDCDRTAGLRDIHVWKSERTDGCTDTHRLESHPISSPSAFSSDELKIQIITICYYYLCLVYVMILNKHYLWKIFPEDEIEKVNYIGQHSAAQLGRGFQTRPFFLFNYFPIPNLSHQPQQPLARVIPEICKTTRNNDKCLWKEYLDILFQNGTRTGNWSN